MSRITRYGVDVGEFSQTSLSSNIEKMILAVVDKWENGRYMLKQI